MQLSKNEYSHLAFVGFGEAAAAFVKGWADSCPARITAYDIKTDRADSATREGKWADYRRWNVVGCNTPGEALAGAKLVFSVVTADQAHVAARQAAAVIEPGSLYFDCNSCAPGAKRHSAELIEAAGGRYVDVAVMAPVHPTLHKTPLLVSGPHTTAALEALGQLGMNAELATGDVGAASSIKLIRSVMVKGLEALVAECLLAGRKAGVDEVVLDSLDITFPGFDWKQRAAYMMERMMVHGVRRAAEMREAALTVDELGLSSDMTRATVEWQQRIGDLHLEAPPADYRARADAVLLALAKPGKVAPAMDRRDYRDIPGTYVFDAEHSRLGYHLNMFCMSLNHEENRAAFRADESAYLDRYPMTPEQKSAILNREWNEMLRLGGNVYYTAKLAATDGITFQDLAAAMTGVSRDQYRKMMLGGGRPIEGNRSKSEWQHG
jgi:protocatechuate 4,5-dioxygenase alpha subunit